jgi:hypothetical protein
MTWAEWVVDFAFLFMPPLSCTCAWWLWIRKHEVMSIPRWRRSATAIALIAVTLSIILGAFAFIYWRHFPGRGPDPPSPTRIATLSGFASAVFAVPFCVLAKSWTRFALVLCCLGLLGFYFGMFVAP